MNITKMRFEQGYAVANTSGDIHLRPKDPAYLNCRASEAQASLHAQSCTARSAYGTNPGLFARRHFSVLVCALERCVCVVALAWHTMPRAGCNAARPYYSPHLLTITIALHMHPHQLHMLSWRHAAGSQTVPTD